MQRFFAGLAIPAVVLMTWGLRAKTVEAGNDDTATPNFYITQVQPIFRANCYRCHGGFNHRGGLNIQTRSGMLKGGHAGPVLVPGDATKSLLVRLIRHEGPANNPMPMPPKSPKLSDADIATITRWVNAGAIIPDSSSRR